MGTVLLIGLAPLIITITVQLLNDLTAMLLNVIKPALPYVAVFAVLLIIYRLVIGRRV
jgi:hypothetical protein